MRYNVHFPGMGYLSESDTFADLVTAHDFVFMGPTSETLLRLGNKIECAHISGELRFRGPRTR